MGAKHQGPWRLRVRTRLLDLVRAVSGEDRLSKCRGWQGLRGEGGEAELLSALSRDACQ